MRRRHVLIAGTESTLAATQHLSCALAHEWGGATTIELVAVAPTCPSEKLCQASALIVLHGEAQAHDVLALLQTAEQADVPALVLRGDLVSPVSANTETYAGALCLPASSSPEVVCATLEGLVHRASELRRLRNELALAQRCHGGLEGEINRMHDELQLAAMVQRELLPRELPSVHGISFGTLWRPANYVSGDIFDVTRLDEDHIGVVLTDAVGHGVPAALMTMVISRSIVMKEIKGDTYQILSPSEVLTRLNQEMLKRQQPATSGARFATAVYALINCRSRTMQVACAGHPPPLLMRCNQPLVELETVGGGLLGVFEDESYEHCEVELHSDDYVLFYSDGFEQAFPQQPRPRQRLRSNEPSSLRLPTNRYREEFQTTVRAAANHAVATHTSPPTTFIEMLNQQLDAQLGSLHQVDDLTLICAHIGNLTTAEPTQQAKRYKDTQHLQNTSTSCLATNPFSPTMTRPGERDNRPPN